MNHPNPCPCEECRSKSKDNLLYKDCQHRGIEVAQEGCTSCGGNVQIKIFACSIHKTCTLAKDLGYVKCCTTCSDYQKKLDE